MGRAKGSTNKISVAKGILVEVYHPFVRCTNCELSKSILINYGKLIIDTRCPNCQCITLKLSSPATTTNYSKE